jgi:hypothetical protein
MLTIPAYQNTKISLQKTFSRVPFRNMPRLFENDLSTSSAETRDTFTDRSFMESQPLNDAIPGCPGFYMPLVHTVFKLLILHPRHVNITYRTTRFSHKSQKYIYSMVQSHTPTHIRRVSLLFQSSWKLACNAHTNVCTEIVPHKHIHKPKTVNYELNICILSALVNLKIYQTLSLSWIWPIIKVRIRNL